MYLHFVKIEAIPHIPNRPSKQLSPVTPTLQVFYLHFCHQATERKICLVWPWPRRFLQMGITTDMACCPRLLPCWQQSSHLALTFTFLRCRFSLVGRIFEQALHTKFQTFWRWHILLLVFNLNLPLKLYFYSLVIVNNMLFKIYCKNVIDIIFFLLFCPSIITHNIISLKICEIL